MKAGKEAFKKFTSAKGDKEKNECSGKGCGGKCGKCGKSCK